MVLVLVLLRLYNFSSQIFLEDVLLALGLNLGPLVEFWVQLPLFKTQVHVVIALGTPRGTITKNTSHISGDSARESRSTLPRRKLELKNHAS